MIRANGTLADLQADPYRLDQEYKRRSGRRVYWVKCDICGEWLSTHYPRQKRHSAKDPDHDCWQVREDRRIAELDEATKKRRAEARSAREAREHARKCE